VEHRDDQASDLGSLLGRRIVLGVTGGIAAYKAVEVCRRLMDAGAWVTPVLTAEAERFVGATTFSALASEPVRRSLWSEAEPVPHTHLGQQADLVLVAPATARFLGLYAGGIAEGLLTATVLATRAPVVVCPAMHTEMWEHPAVQENVARLARRGVRVVGPATGRLAGGDSGPGRLVEPAEILTAVAGVLRRRGQLAGRRVLVTAGGTREPIDPVRVLTNRSSGRQGHALAEAARDRGAEVVLVTTTDRPGPPGARVLRVETAAQMAEAVLAEAPGCDVVVMAAAVADFRPVAVAPTKLKKSEGPPKIELVPTEDILAELGRRRRPGQVLVGFAAETGDPEAEAARKLVAKGVDLVVANDVSRPEAGFESETNEVLVLDAAGGRSVVTLRSKREVAEAVLDRVVDWLGTIAGQAPARAPAQG